MENFFKDVAIDLLPSPKHLNKKMNHFLNDVLKGLQSSPKYLYSKYFYDKKGDELFQKIMVSKEYYLTNSEMEIFSTQTEEMANTILEKTENIDVVEFGAGDATKSVYLLKELSKRNALNDYVPIDISENIIHLLNKTLPGQIPGINIHGLNGEYLNMLSQANQISTTKKLVLFLGANIGNFKFTEMPEFCKKLRNLLSDGDMVLIGFDLKKDPKKILAAYNDSKGFTSQFNLNLLKRINNELNANFNLENFEHYAMYDPDSGACKSYLVSMEKQKVHLNGSIINFKKDETIFMEISHKYTISNIHEIAHQCGFVPGAYFFDTKKYFVDVIWKCETVK
ncbi:MAG TPA: L-histidine N(alpha)-methyltransferase [Hanamia sp.]|nr:L-histidine N(alpha)-methyltransferase [Hanamia sp.]